jgi:hypothetical protein
MDIKLIIYIVVTPIVVYAMDSLNINGMFKKNRNIQANIMYILIAFSLIYLITNMVADIFFT